MMKYIYLFACVLLAAGVFAQPVTDPDFDPNYAAQLYGNNLWLGNIAIDQPTPTQNTPAQPALSMAPNPANHYTIINLEKWRNVPVDIVMYDALGRIVFTDNILAEDILTEDRRPTYYIDLTHFLSGTYSIHLTHPTQKTEILKLVIVH